MRILFVTIILSLCGCATQDSKNTHMDCHTTDESLKPYNLSLSNHTTGESYTGEIFLPPFPRSSNKFCGYWVQHKLTQNKKRILQGKNHGTLYISLYPNLHDAGYIFYIENREKWVGQGKLYTASIAGELSVGTYDISQKKVIDPEINSP